VISDPDVPAPPANPLQARTRPDAHMYLRPDAVLRAISGRDRLAEPRFNPDATLDLQQWGRPQHDGPALRVLALLHVAEAVPDLVEPALDTLLARDLDFLCAVAGEPCIGPWEEAPERRHAFTLIVQWDALERGAERCRRAGDTDGARRMAEAASRAAAVAEKAFDPAEGGWFDCVETDTYDASVVLGILHAGRRSGPFAIDAPRTAATVAALERRFAVRYPINRGRTVPAIGRWADDVYFGGNPWFPTTLGFAELHYRIAAAGGPDASAAFARAEQWMALVREVAPEGDALPEQFDRAHGRPTGCLALTWSAAAFIGAAEARAAALQATGPVCVNPSADKPV